MGERLDAYDVETDALREVETIASGRGVKIRAHLNARFGRRRWRKLKGVARASYVPTGRLCEVEVHWFEAHGIGRVLKKVKKRLRWM